jgi:hypothetical protein
MNLAEYIAAVGTKVFAKKLGITERAALSYKQKTRIPRAELARKIVMKTPVTWAGIYGADASNSPSGPSAAHSA